MYFNLKIDTDTHDIDYNGVARASALMRYMQSAADSQLTSIGLSYEKLREMKRGFILSRMTIEFGAAVRDHDRLISETFPAVSRGFGFLRCYRLLRGDDEVARGIAQWALIDTDSRSLVRVNDFELGLEVHEPLSLAIGRFSIPHTVIEVGTYKIGYSDTDRNGHMNNTHYPDLYANFLPMEGKRIARMSISFLTEAPLGSVLSVQMASDGAGRYFIRTVRPDAKTNTEAEIYLTEI